MNFYQHHIGDYARDTAHLTPLEDGTYRRMLDLYYASEKPLPLNIDRLCRLVRARTRQEREAVDTILTEFFKREADGWHNKRADEEIAKALAKSEKARGSAAQRWQSERNANASANAMRTHSEGNAPRHQEPDTKNQETLSTTPVVEAPDGAAPDCPHEKIISIYHEILPTNPQVIEWNDQRRGYLRARWREKSKPNGVSQGYTTVEGGLAYWRKFFSYVAQSTFLTGQGEGKQGRPPFVADLEWLVRPTNFAKVIEGKYHR